ncbi:MAG TPA: HAD family hydrolase [Patescibacteria group bacterium]|nr:HAD family hydrolase [Patescibacteria group bacterium]
MDKLLLLDIDGTLFNPEQFGRLIRHEFVRILGVSEEEIVRANADYYATLPTTTDFNPRDIAQHIANAFSVDQAELDKVFWENEQIYKESLFPEVLDTLKKLSKTHTLGIFSQGNEELQTRKLNACDIAQFFDRNYLYIHKRKLEEEVLNQIPEAAIIVDDNHDWVKEINAKRGAIWLNRRTEDKDPSLTTIHLLSDLLAL